MFTIKQNVYDNWYGYDGSKKVAAFFNTVDGDQQAGAERWLAEQVALTFTPETIDPEWQRVTGRTTPHGRYRVEITWALDHYRVSAFSVWGGVPDVCIRRGRATTKVTAARRGNMMLRNLGKRENSIDKTTTVR